MLSNNLPVNVAVELDGDIIKKVTPETGKIHRGVEKLLEHKTYTQSIPFFDRLDSNSSFNQEYAFVLAVEKLLDVKVPERSKCIRVLFAELDRIASHIYNIAVTAEYLGSHLASELAFNEHAKILKFFKHAIGCKYNSNYFLPGGVRADISKELLDDATKLISDDFISKIEKLLTKNPVFKSRTVNIGSISKEEAIEYGFSGIMLRSAGVKWDIRKSKPYCIYKDLDFEIPVAISGDCYARYCLRVAEIKESIKIIKQVVNKIPAGKIKIEDGKIVPPTRDAIKDSLGAMIHHTKFYTESYRIGKSEVYVPVESPKGEFGVFLVADGSNKPYRCHIRSASFNDLQFLNHLANGEQDADLVTIINSMDLDLGGIDR